MCVLVQANVAQRDTPEYKDNQRVERSHESRLIFFFLICHFNIEREVITFLSWSEEKGRDGVEHREAAVKLLLLPKVTREQLTTN